jgi:quercetin dioxygenase-like cupin family protein
VIASALRVPVADLFVEVDQSREEFVVRFDEQSVVSPWPGVARRTAKVDRLRHLEISMNEWEPHGQIEPQPARHVGFEYGLLIEGELTVDVGFTSHVLRSGDLICYPSTVLHRLRNSGDSVARAVWVNLEAF